jgi:hypothetical protein
MCLTNLMGNANLMGNINIMGSTNICTVDGRDGNKEMELITGAETRHLNPPL